MIAPRLMSCVAAVAAVVGSLLTTAPARAEGPNVTHFKLDNGLEVVVIPDTRAPVVTHMIWYKVGAADEPPGKSGIAHFLEHLMFKGTRKHPAGEFSRDVAAMGGQENAFTTEDYTAFYQRVPRDKLRDVMEFEADRMTGLVLTDETVNPELQVVLEEYNMRVANSPAARLNEQIEAALYLNSPYGKPTIGWRHEIVTLNRDDALSFYRRFYTPNNAVVIVAGDVDAAEVRKLAEATYGKVERRSDTPPRHRPQEPPPQAVRSLTYADARVEQPQLQRDYLVPSDATAAPGEAEALNVLAHVLGGGSNSRLYEALVVDQGLAVDIGAWYTGSMLDASQFGISARPRPGVTLPQLETAIDGVIADFLKRELSADELARAKTKLIADSVYAQDSQATLARWYGTALTTGRTVADVQSWPDRIRAVTAPAVREAARKWLDKRRSVTGYLVKDAGHVEAKTEKRS
jgi:zinc protease